MGGGGYHRLCEWAWWECILQGEPEWDICVLTLLVMWKGFGVGDLVVDGWFVCSLLYC